MNNSSLIVNLKESFREALKPGQYISTGNKQDRFQIQKTKVIRLNEVFSKAIDYLETDKYFLIGHSTEEKKRQIDDLTELAKDGQKLYNHYAAKVNKWLSCHRFFKIISFFVPSFLKKYFPSVFTNKVAAAEENTKTQFNSFMLKITQLKAENIKVEAEVKDTEDDLSKNPGQVNGEDDNLDDSNDKPTTPPTPAKKPQGNKKPLTPVKEEDFDIDAAVEELENDPTVKALDFESMKDQSIHDDQTIITRKIETQISLLNSPENTISLIKFKRTLSELLSNLSSMKQIHAEAIPEILKECTIVDPLLALLTTSKKLNVSTNEELTVLLKGTSWEKSFATALANHNEGELISKKLPGPNGGTVHKFKSATGVEKPANTFKDYKGSLTVSENLIPDLKELNQKMNCCPTTLVIRTDEDKKALSAETARTLIKLSTELPSITIFQLDTIEEINIHEMGLTAEEEKQFLKLIPLLLFPKLTKFVLSNHSKNDFSADDFYSILEFAPGIQLLKQCYTQAKTGLDLKIPLTLKKTTLLNLEGFTLELTLKIIPHFDQIQELTLDSGINDKQLAKLIKDRCFKNIKSLIVKNNKVLTTDCIEPLSNLESLSHLELPQLKKGKAKLEDLPKFENPFKIALFYVPQPLTQSIARDLYRGPSAWACVFQIPLTIAGEENVFSSKDRVLDSNSVANWLKNDNYKSLPAGRNGSKLRDVCVNVILADNCKLINDDNVIAFISKFPQTTVLSLHNCPNITDKGVQKVLTYLPLSGIKKVDLSNNPQITFKAIIDLDDANVEKTKKNIGALQKLNVSGTQINDKNIETLELISPGIKKKIDCKIISLKITNEQLLDENALESLLKEQPIRDLISLDFEGCTNLTDKMLSLVLARLNDDDIFINKDTKVETKNPQRLNCVCLNLKGCSQITDEAFVESEKDGKKNFKILGNLYQIVSGGTKITADLKLVYPMTTFQEVYSLIRQDSSFVQDCISDYFDGKTKNLIDPCSPEYANIELSFREIKPEAKPTVFKTHKDILYAQSFFFRSQLRTGIGMKTDSIPQMTIENQHATPKAAEGLMNILKGDNKYEKLDFFTACDVAELASSKGLQLPGAYHLELLMRIRKLIETQFDWRKADTMLMKVNSKMLNDSKSIKLIEEGLVKALRTKGLTVKDVKQILGIARSHELKGVMARCDALLAKQLQKKEVDEENALVRLEALTEKEQMELALQNSLEN